MEESVGCILKTADPFVTQKLETFLKETPGIKLIYFHRSPHHKLYIIDAERMKKITEREYHTGDKQNTNMGRK